MREKFCVVIALLAVFASVCASVHAEDITLEPSARGGLTAWHVAGPFPESVEPTSSPAGGLPDLGKRKQGWRFVANYPTEMSVVSRWRRVGHTYLFARFIGSGKKCVFKIVHDLPVRVWVNGRQVKIQTRSGKWRSYSTFSLNPRRGTSSVLIEVRNGIFAAYCDNKDIRQTMPEDSSTTLAEAIARSISVDGNRMGVRPDKPFSVEVRVEGSRVVFDGPTDITVTFRRENGRKITEKKITAARMENLADGIISEFKISQPGPFYRVETKVVAGSGTASANLLWTFNMADVHKKAQAIVNAASDLPRESPAKANLELRSEKLCILFDDYLFKSSFCRRIREEFQAAKGIGAGRGPGLQEHVYLSDIDDSPQPYLVYVPKSYKAGRPTPMIVFLHGYTPYLDKVDWDMMPSSIFGLAERKGILLAVPFARGNTDFQGAGEDDVLKVIRLVKDKFSVDERRIFLAGISMGGSGVWTIGAHYPHLFAGVIPVSGRNDYLFWHRYEQTPTYADLFCRGDFGYELAENFRNLPVFCIHGGEDSLVETEQSRRMVKKLKELGFDVTYKEIPGGDHWIWEEAFVQEGLEDWLGQKVLDPAPTRVTYRTYSIKYHRAYWLDLTRIAQWGRPAYVDGVVMADRTSIVKTYNLAALSLVDGTVFARGKKTDVRINGRQYAIAPGGPGVRLDKSSPADKFPGEKTTGLCGPFREIFSGSFRIVHGKDDKKGRQIALAFAAQWQKFSQGRAVVIPDAAVDKKMLDSCNLVLAGCNETNEIIKRVSGNIPLVLEKNSISIAGKTFKRENTGLIAIYPNPLAPGRYLGFIWGEIWGSHKPANHVWDEVPDFLVFTKTSSKGIQNVKVLLAGYFDSRWR